MARATACAPDSIASAPPAVTRAIEYIERHLCETVGVHQLAAAACMSRFHFARVFRRATGYSPMEYLRHRRIEQAQVLLLEGRHKVSEIANDLGFFDQSHFVRRFRRATGCTPARYARTQSRADVACAAAR
ncbi:MAG TPA: AraC family transcriptional regulator [Stenotrophomonas sp.]|jgi:AraC-like DNA-binding protein